MRVVEVLNDGLVFDSGWILKSYHPQDCCESHYLDFEPLSLKDFEDLEFDLTFDGAFFTRIKDFGIALNPKEGWPVRIAGYGDNNGFYSDNIYLMILDENGKELTYFDITECQEQR